MEKEELSKLMCIKRIRGYTNNKIIDILKEGGSIEGLFSHLIKNSLIREGYKEEAYNLIDYCSEHNIKILSFFDEEYPSKLKQISSAPLFLFAKGNLGLLNKKGVSIVGSRESSKESLDWAYDCAKEFASKGYVIISGGAKGIDTSAHKGALDANGDTICVLGGGLDKIYPKENESLINKIVERGLVISEYPPLDNVNRFSLLERNRLTSGLGDFLLLVTATISGGSLSQYKVAVSQRKDIFCPHPDLDLNPKDGIIGLIKANKIKTIHDIEDISQKADFKEQLVLESFN